MRCASSEVSDNGNGIQVNAGDNRVIREFPVSTNVQVNVSLVSNQKQVRYVFQTSFH